MAAVSQAVDSSAWWFFWDMEVMEQQSWYYASHSQYDDEDYGVLHRRWGFPQGFDAVVLPLAWLQEDHHDEDRHWTYYGDRDYQRLPAHIQIDKQDVFGDLIKQLEDAPAVNRIRIPEVLLDELLNLTNCRQCQLRGIGFFQSFFEELTAVVHNAVDEVCLPHIRLQSR